MSDEPPERRPLITPPPGLLPDPPRRDDVPEGTDSGTRRLARDSPVFFPGGPGARTVEIPDPEKDVDRDAADAPRAQAGVPTGETPVAAPTWSLRTADGTTHRVPEGGLVIGRNPARPEGWEHAEVLGVMDPAKTVSKTHAALRVESGTLTVVDLSSTNGTTIAAPDGTDATLAPGVATPVPDGATVGLGSFPLRATRS